MPRFYVIISFGNQNICPQFFNSDFISSKPSFAYFLSYFVQQSNLLIHSVLLECPLSTNSYSHRTVVVLWKKKTRERNWPIIILLLCTIMCSRNLYHISTSCFWKKIPLSYSAIKEENMTRRVMLYTKNKKKLKIFFQTFYEGFEIKHVDDVNVVVLD